MRALHLKSAVFVAVLLAVASSVYAARPVRLSDAQLREKIVGVWFSEELPNLMKHIGTRMQYFPDGRFLGDYRISGPGSEQYLRTVGNWKVGGGEFSEIAEKTSDPDISFPTFVRHVVAIDRNHVILETSDGTRAELWRGKRALETGARSVSSLDRSYFLRCYRCTSVVIAVSQPAVAAFLSDSTVEKLRTRLNNET